MQFETGVERLPAEIHWQINTSPTPLFVAGALVADTLEFQSFLTACLVGGT